MADVKFFSTPVPPGQVLTGQSLSKGARFRTPRQRAKKAAQWVLGGILLRPSIRLAAIVFQVSVQLINEEVAKLKAIYGDVMPMPIEAVWQAMTEAERVEFVHRHQHELWHVFDRVTAAAA